MKYYSFTYILTITLCFAITQPSFAQSKNKKPKQNIKIKKTNKIHFDTSTTAIIQFDPRAHRYIFDSSHKSATLTQSAINIIDSLLVVCVNEYNDSLDSEYKEWNINLKEGNYRCEK